MRKHREWIEFKEIAARRLPNTIRATLNPKGEFVFDRNTFELMKQPEAVLLLFDPGSDTIVSNPRMPTLPTPSSSAPATADITRSSARGRS